MNIIDTSLIVDPGTQQPFLGPSLAFLQAANKEMFKGVVRSIIGDYNYGTVSVVDGVAINGCTFVSGGNILTEGFIFYQDELYYFTGMSGLLSPPFTSPNVPVFVASNSNAGFDPVTFSDGTTYNVHNIRRLTLVGATSGSGLFDMSHLVNYSFGGKTNKEIVTSGYTTSTSSQEAVTGLTFTTPTISNRNWKFSFVGAIEWTSVNSLADGGILTIRNQTTSTDIATVDANITQNSGGGGAIPHMPINVTHTPTVLAPGTTIIITLQQFRSGGNQPTLTGVFVIEEISMT